MLVTPGKALLPSWSFKLGNYQPKTLVLKKLILIIVKNIFKMENYAKIMHHLFLHFLLELSNLVADSYVLIVFTKNGTLPPLKWVILFFFVLRVLKTYFRFHFIQNFFDLFF